MDLDLDRKEIFLVSVIILMISAWTIGNLVGAYFGMEDEDIGGPTERAEHDGATTPFSLDIPDYLRDIFFVLIILAFGGGILSSDESWRGKSLRGAVFLCVISFIYFADYIFPIFLSTLSRFSSVFPDIDYFFPEINFENGFEQIFSPIGYSVGILVLLTSVLVFILFFIRHKKLSKQSSETEEHISSTADRALTELHEGEDIRDVIIRNYQKMLIILEKEGIKQEISFTPRELEKIALSRLPLAEGTIDEMTRLFEEAKYSDHPLGDKERKRAIDNFKQIKDELEVLEDA